MPALDRWLHSDRDGGSTTDRNQTSIARGFLFADLRGYSAWVETHGDHAAVELLRAYRTLVRQAVADHHGAEVKTEGDSFYVVFDSPSAAVTCGLRILELAAASQGAAGGPIPVGIGVHAGETVPTDEGFVGSAVNVAARVCAQARAGELLATDAVRSLTRTYLDVAYQARGRRKLKGISEPIGLYRVTAGRATQRSVPAWRRRAANRPLVAAALAIPVIAVVALVGGALVREGAAGPASDAGPSPSAPSSATVSVPGSPASSAISEFPTPAEAALVQLIPQQHRDACERDPGDTPVQEVHRIPGEPTQVRRAPSAASIVCDLGGIADPDRLWLWDLNTFGARVRPDPAHVAIAAHGGLVGATQGTCRVAPPAIETWSFGDLRGTLLCYETDTGDAVLMWVYDDNTRLFAKALRDDRDMAALLDWWEDGGRFVAP